MSNSRAAVWSVPLVLALCVAAFPRGAAAQTDDERARTHFEAGTSYYDQRRFSDALREFEEAYRLSDRHALLLNISVAYERLDEHEQAAEYIDRYLELVPDSPRRRILTARATELRRTAAERAQERAGNAPSDEARVDGARADGARADGARADGAGADGTRVGDAQAVLPGSSAGGSELGPGFFAGLATLGAALAAGGVAIGTGLVADERYAQLAAGCQENGGCPSSLAPTLDEAHTMATLNTAFTFTAIGLAALGGVLIVLDLAGVFGGGGSDGGEPDAQSASLSVDVGAGRVGVELALGW